MTSKYRALVVTALAGAMVLALGASAFAQTGFDSTQSGGTVDLGPGMGTANRATGGGLEAAAIGELGDASHGPCVRDVLDLPALNACEDAQGRIVMDLPALKLVGPAKARAAGPDADRPGPGTPGRHGTRGAPDRLPTTGVNVGDLMALGMAALSGGGVLLRRLRLSLAS